LGDVNNVDHDNSNSQVIIREWCVHTHRGEAGRETVADDGRV